MGCEAESVVFTGKVLQTGFTIAGNGVRIRLFVGRIGHFGVAGINEDYGEEIQGKYFYC